MHSLPDFPPADSLSRLRVLFVGGYWMGVNDVVNVYLCGLRDLGVNVVEYSTDAHPEALDHGQRRYDRGTYGPVYLKWEFLRPVVEQHDPHIVVCCAGGLAFHPEVAAELRKTRVLIGMAMSDPDVFDPATRHIAPTFDHFFTNHLGTAARHREQGADAYWLPFPCYPKFHYRRPMDPRFACDMIVVGAGREDRARLVKPLYDRFDVKVFGSDWEAYGIRALDWQLAQQGLIAPAFSSARLALDFARNLRGLPIVKLRVFEITGCGGIVCTERCEELERLFGDDAVIGFSSPEELLDKAAAVLADPVLEASLRRNAYWRAHSEHTVEHRWRAVLSQCGAQWG